MDLTDDDTRDVLTKEWTDWIDYWAVDFDYTSRAETLLETVTQADGSVTRALFDTVKGAINRLTIHDSGDTHVIDRIKLSDTRPQVVRRRDTIEATKSLMNKVAGDNPFELAFASFLEAAPDVQAFYKNSEATNFTIEYQSAGGGIVRDYRPDFIARDSAGAIWIIETKGREDLEDPRKWERLKLWCEDASVQDAPNQYRALFVRQDDWESLLNPVRNLGDAEAAFGGK